MQREGRSAGPGSTASNGAARLPGQAKGQVLGHWWSCRPRPWPMRWSGSSWAVSRAQQPGEDLLQAGRWLSLGLGRPAPGATAARDSAAQGWSRGQHGGRLHWPPLAGSGGGATGAGAATGEGWYRMAPWRRWGTAGAANGVTGTAVQRPNGFHHGPMLRLGLRKLGAGRWLRAIPAALLRRLAGRTEVPQTGSQRGKSVANVRAPAGRCAPRSSRWLPRARCPSRIDSPDLI